MKTLMKNVIKSEIHSIVTIDEKVTKKTEYKDGGSLIETTTVKRVIQRPGALLECGHWRMNDSAFTFSGQQKLRCYECDAAT